ARRRPLHVQATRPPAANGAAAAARPAGRGQGAPHGCPSAAGAREVADDAVAGRGQVPAPHHFEMLNCSAIAAPRDDMARGGINKAVVEQARQALLGRGVYPSIDAVRVELGNTGSKTTIARCLKELETQTPREATSRERMSGELKALVEGLLDRLAEESVEVVAQAQAEFDRQRAEWEARLEGAEADLKSARLQCDSQQAALTEQSGVLQTTHSSWQTELTRNAKLSQQCQDLERRVEDKERQIQSLEEKHVHARAALEHYREAMKTQREQDQRRHEAQLQQIQLEQRKLQETLVIKQDESTRLNRDNERLLGELRQQARALTD
nr:hypothetical protein [Tanacetum cinerariifolium]